MNILWKKTNFFRAVRSFRCLQASPIIGKSTPLVSGGSSPISPPSPYSLSAVRSYRSYGESGSWSRHDGVYEIKPPKNMVIWIVPEKQAFVVERFGEYLETLESGIHFLIPFVDRIAYVYSLKEGAISIPKQTLYSTYNENIYIDSILYIKIVDPKLASYTVENPINAVIELAKLNMRRELRKITRRVFKEEDTLNKKIVENINNVAKDWGLKCLRLEISQS